MISFILINAFFISMIIYGFKKAYRLLTIEENYILSYKNFFLFLTLIFSYLFGVNLILSIQEIIGDQDQDTISILSRILMGFFSAGLLPLALFYFSRKSKNYYQLFDIKKENLIHHVTHFFDSLEKKYEVGNYSIKQLESEGKQIVINFIRIGPINDNDIADLLYYLRYVVELKKNKRVRFMAIMMIVISTIVSFFILGDIYNYVVKYVG